MGQPSEADGDEITFTKHLSASRLPVGGAPPSWLDHHQFQVENDGIYRGVPVYDSTYHGKTAIVAGANGISGAHMLRAMARHPDVWSQVHALSRRPPGQTQLPAEFAKKVSHHCIDLNTSPGQVGKDLKKAGITQCDYALFFAYIQTEPKERTALWAGAKELAEVNGQLFLNFLEGMKAAGIKPKRVLLQTGGKTYSSHLGPVVSPNWEDDVERARTYKEPNFYYTQEDIMWKYCRDNDVEWACCRPGVILGIVQDNALNLIIPLALYAAITKYMGEKTLKFPGTRAALEQIHDVGSAVHNGIFMEWQMLAPQAANQIFNLNDGTPFSWLRFWEWYSGFFGLGWEPPLAEDDPNANWTTYSTSDDTPPVGYGNPSTCKYSFTLADWSQRKDVRAAWAEMVKEYGLNESAIDMRYSWAMANWAMCRWWNVNLGMAKARKYGYFGAVDWTDSIAAVFREAAEMKIIPRPEDLKG